MFALVDVDLFPMSRVNVKASGVLERGTRYQSVNAPTANTCHGLYTTSPKGRSISAQVDH